MRNFSFITISRIVRDIQQEGISRFNRVAFYRMVHQNQWPLPARTKGKWRNFGPVEPEKFPNIPNSAPYYKALIKRAYGIPVELPPRPEGLTDYRDAIRDGLE